MNVVKIQVVKMKVVKIHVKIHLTKKNYVVEMNVVKSVCGKIEAVKM